jgi:hypothetical protein
MEEIVYTFWYLLLHPTKYNVLDRDTVYKL